MDMAQVRIVTDSAADLRAETVVEYGITVVPLVVRFGDEVYANALMTCDEFWAKVASSPHHPGTSQPPMGVFEEAFGRLVEAGHPVLYVALTSKHSGTYSTACAAAQRFGDQVKVIDSLSLSLGQGELTLAAARAANKGLSLEQVAEAVRDAQSRSHLLILLNTIEYIRRGGRADAIMPILDRVTKMLDIKPILNVDDGKLGLHGLARSYERGLSKLRQQILQLAPVERMAVGHIRHPELAEKTARILSTRLDFPLEQIRIVEAGPLLSTHGGPKVVGVAVVQGREA
jgi:DegV family protein with EDD domain